MIHFCFRCYLLNFAGTQTLEILLNLLHHTNSFRICQSIVTIVRFILKINNRTCWNICVEFFQIIVFNSFFNFNFKNCDFALWSIRFSVFGHTSVYVETINKVFEFNPRQNASNIDIICTCIFIRRGERNVDLIESILLLPVKILDEFGVLIYRIFNWCLSVVVLE